jgi:hypothetical protein
MELLLYKIGFKVRSWVQDPLGDNFSLKGKEKKEKKLQP